MSLASVTAPQTIHTVSISYTQLKEKNVDLSSKIEEGFGPNGLGILSISDVPGYSLLRQNLLHLAPRLANLSEEVKKELEDPHSRYNFGWSHGKEKLESGKPDMLKGSFYANPIIDVPTTEKCLINRYPSYCAPNIWPHAALPELEVAFKALGKLILDVGLMVAYHCDRYVSKGIMLHMDEGLEQTLIRSRCHKGRLLYYFPAERSKSTQESDSMSSWCGWHTDHGSLTGLTSGMFMRDAVEVICPDSSAGLYIKTRSGQVVKVVYGENEIAYQIGETTEILSRGHLCATPHCVQAPKGADATDLERATFALFMQPDWDEKLNFPEKVHIHQEALVSNLPDSKLIESCSVTGRGFVNIVLSRQWIAKSIHKMLMDGIGSWAPKLPVKRAVVDFSSPNIAKEMHVGHLRSTIIGDTLARMLEFSNVEVLRRNHVGDWGTQFGMLIEFLFEKFPDLEDANDQAIGDLEAFYKASKKRFDSDSSFKGRAQQAVVSLQGGEEKYRKAWKQICDVSRKGYEQVYKRLGVYLEEKGESFYNPYIPMVLDLLNEKGLVEENEGARVIFIEGKKIPLIVTKKDGGFNYASTDLTALWYRLNEEKAEWVIYVTDDTQKYHFDMIFSAAKRAGWLPAEEKKYPKTDHVAFGLVFGEDGKRFRTRSTEVVRLIDLLDKAKACCKAKLVERGEAREWTDEELEQTAEAVGYGAVKYADLKNNRLTGYTFNFEQMLDDKGDTAVYLLYAYARICSIIKKSGREIEELEKVGNLELIQDAERALGLHLIRFAEVVEEACSKLLPHLLCKYLYGLSEALTKFYSDCPVLGSTAETSRLLLCKATEIVMKKCFYLLGITPVDKM